MVISNQCFVFTSHMNEKGGGLSYCSMKFLKVHIR